MRSTIAAGAATLGVSAPAAAHDDEEEEETEKDEAKEDEKEEDETEEDETEEEETEEDEKEEEEQDDTAATVSISNHETSGETVTVESVSMDDGGFVSIHDRRRFDGEILPSIIGITEYLEAGSHEDVSVPLFTENATAPGPAEGQDEDGLTESQPLIAIPHRDDTDSGEFDGDDSAYAEGPKTLGEIPVVNDIATVYVEGDDEEEREAAEEEEAEAREEF